MTGISRVNFTSAEQQQKTEKNKKVKKEVVYVSKNPDATVNATGVVAGTSGMIGGAILGGLVGVAKLPRELVNSVAGANYAELVGNSLNGFKDSVKNTPEFANLINAFRNSNSPQAAEEIIHIAKTLMGRLNTAFNDDAVAKSVINKTIDPIIQSISIKKDIQNLWPIAKMKVQLWLKPSEPVQIPMTANEYRASKNIFKPIKTLLYQLLGTPNSHTSKTIGGFTGTIAEGIAQSVENIKNFTPEEKEAWGRITHQIKEEFMHNPKLQKSSAIGKAIKSAFTDLTWLTDSIKNLQENLLKTIKDINKGISYAPLKTIGIWATIGATACGTLSTLGWFGLKKGLMKKETAKAQAANA